MTLSKAAVAVSAFSLFTLTAAATGSQGSCFEQGWDYTGYDILTLSGVNSQHLCMESCAQSADCFYWSWSVETSICYLKSAAALLGRTEHPGIISGPRSCEVNYGCYAEGTDYSGFDVKRIEGQDVASAEICQEMCNQEPQCAFFSYKASTKDCYLKSASAPIGRRSDPDVTSGPRVCTNDTYGPDLPEKTCTEGGVEYRGADVAVVRSIRSVSHCQQICAANHSCYYWTWDKKTHVCYQKDKHAIDFKQSGKYTVGKVSGPKDCLPVNPGCQYKNTTFLGNVVGQLKSSPTFESCQANCQNDEKCTHWTWEAKRKLCLLRDSSPHGFVSDSSTVGIVAGPKFCPNDDVCVEQGDYVGHDIDSVKDGSVASAIECRSVCRQTEGCEFWTWVESTGECYLKDGDALLGRTVGLGSIGKFSGPRDCFMHYGCMEDNAAYFSESSTRLRKISSYLECEKQCKTKGCDVWTYLTESNVCTLTSGEVTRIPYDGAISGSDCKKTEVQRDNKCLMEGVRFKATETAMINTVESVNECHYECMNTAGCKTFTFEDKLGCYLYDKDPADLAQYPVNFPTATSGFVDCDTDFRGEANTCYEGTALPGSFYAYNDAQCATKCTESVDCLHWTYNPTQRNVTCTLFGFAKKTTCSNGRSGSRVVPKITFGSRKYEGADVVLQDVDNFEACATECANHEMFYWTYYQSTKQCHLLGSGNHVMKPEANAFAGYI